MFQIGDTKLTSSFNPRKAVGMKKKGKGKKEDKRKWDRKSDKQ